MNFIFIPQLTNNAFGFSVQLPYIFLTIFKLLHLLVTVAFQGGGLQPNFMHLHLLFFSPADFANFISWMTKVCSVGSFDSGLEWI